MKKFLVFLTVFSFGLTAAFADIRQEQLVLTAVDVLNMTKSDQQIDKKKVIDIDKLYKEAKAVLIVPNTNKAGFIVSGIKGDGIFLIKQGDKQWSAPLFVNFRGYGIGPQAGFESSNLVLVFKTRRSFDKILDNKELLNISGSITPFRGYESGLDTDFPEISAEIVSFAKSSGLFLGVSIDGAQISVDYQDNLDYYGRLYTLKDIVQNVPKPSIYTKAIHNYLANNF